MPDDPPLISPITQFGKLRTGEGMKAARHRLKQIAHGKCVSCAAEAALQVTFQNEDPLESVRLRRCWTHLTNLRTYHQQFMAKYRDNYNAIRRLKYRLLIGADRVASVHHVLSAWHLAKIVREDAATVTLARQDYDAMVTRLMQLETLMKETDTP